MAAPAAAGARGRARATAEAEGRGEGSAGARPRPRRERVVPGGRRAGNGMRHPGRSGPWIGTAARWVRARSAGDGGGRSAVGGKWTSSRGGGRTRFRRGGTCCDPTIRERNELEREEEGPSEPVGGITKIADGTCCTDPLSVLFHKAAQVAAGFTGFSRLPHALARRQRRLQPPRRHALGEAGSPYGLARQQPLIALSGWSCRGQPTATPAWRWRQNSSRGATDMRRATNEFIACWCLSQSPDRIVVCAEVVSTCGVDSGSRTAPLAVEASARSHHGFYTRTIRLLSLARQTSVVLTQRPIPEVGDTRR